MRRIDREGWELDKSSHKSRKEGDILSHLGDGRKKGMR